MLFQMMTGLECGHSYCTSCWTEYLSTKIMDEGVCNFTKKDFFFCEMKNYNIKVVTHSLGKKIIYRRLKTFLNVIL